MSMPPGSPSPNDPWASGQPSRPGMPPPGYGYGPAYPTGPGGYGPDPVRPGSVTGALWLWIAAAIAAAVSAVLVFTSDVWAQALTEAAHTAGVSGDRVQALITTAKAATAVAAVIFVVLYLFFAARMYAGRNWARIVLTVVAALTVAGSFSTQAAVPVGGVTYRVGAGDALHWVQLGLAILALVLMWARPSNAYFAAVKTRRTYR